MALLTQRPGVAYRSPTNNYRQQLAWLLSQDLGFHDNVATHGRHSLHAFPAKFPPQLPRLFIDTLTQPGDQILDPMMGSGTTLIEAMLANRNALGFDIDPMAVRISQAKATSLDAEAVQQAGQCVVERASARLLRPATLQKELTRRFDGKSLEFVQYWFAQPTQLELMALLSEIERVTEAAIREFLTLCFSAIIITKSGGVSLARDLAHTRPHRVTDKTPRPAIAEFKKRLDKNLKNLPVTSVECGQVRVQVGNAEALPLAEASVDLIFTSPPYASNAIDYMRAHKFSLVWLGHPIQTLSVLRRNYIGGEATQQFAFEDLPARSTALVAQVTQLDRKKGLTLQRYYSEMTRVLKEAERVLKPGKAAALVVGSSVMRGIDTQTPTCIGEIGQTLGFDLVGIATRSLDRDRRMMPARFGGARASQIEERMHEEQVVVLLKP